ERFGPQRRDRLLGVAGRLLIWRHQVWARMAVEGVTAGRGERRVHGESGAEPHHGRQVLSGGEEPRLAAAERPQQGSPALVEGDAEGRAVFAEEGPQAVVEAAEPFVPA